MNDEMRFEKYGLTNKSLTIKQLSSLTIKQLNNLTNLQILN